MVRPTRAGQPDPGVRVVGQQARPGQAGDGGLRRAGVHLERVGQVAGERTPVDGTAGGRGERERHPLVAAGAGAGQDAVEYRPVRVLGPADELWSQHHG